MGLSGAAITYLVERMAETGHLRRETDPSDRRKVILRYDEHGMEIAMQFFGELAEHNRRAMAHLPDEDLDAAHRTFSRDGRGDARLPDRNREKDCIRTPVSSG